MKIRNATPEDLSSILTIYDDARAYMRQSGNMTQWSGGYPSEELIRNDIESGRFFVCVEDGNNPEILAVFFFRVGEDPTYREIYEGKWLNDAPYGVIHRIAVSKNSHGKGVAAFCFDFCSSLCDNVRIDTHRDNIPMQRALGKNGFHYCGIIHLENGDPRVAYEKVL